MKVTTELKRLIHTQFEKERDAARKEVAELEKDRFDSFCAAVEASPEWRDFAAARQRMYEKYNDRIVKSSKDYPVSNGTPVALSSIENLKTSRVRDFFCMWSRGSVLYPEGFKYTQQAEDSLLVRLTYEKDLERIQALLREYDLEL